MARSDAVWAIDIGQCSLKALRCRAHDEPGRIVADAFDHIAYPKILSQPDADPAELVQDALKQFLSRNTVRGDRVAISVAGQNGLARFIKLPPVESKKIPDIVRYEARQQIPFDLDDVVWDYQRMGGGSEEEGFALETEIGLFAMKREQVYRALEPFSTAGIEVDVVQLTPLALYNYMLFDQLYNLPPVEDFDPENPPPSIVILSLGTDATDLVVTNGYRVWQRSIPLGGNHFTKALTKGLKLTFAKAEHVKCNISSAKDPKVLFQAMRPVFNDLLTEIQRSIGYFTSIDRNAKIEKIVGLGNAMKMPGLRGYLAKSLGMKVVRADSFRGLTGSEVLGAPAFRENLLCYGVCYGLAAQALEVGRGTLTTNLLPREIVKDRFIRGKKPWAAAAAAVLLLGCTIFFAAQSLALNSVDEGPFKSAEQKCSSVVSQSQQIKGDNDTARQEFEATEQIGQHLVGNVENRILWLELLRTINACLPNDPQDKSPKDIMQRNELHITNLECQKVSELKNWFKFVNENHWYQAPPGEKKKGADGTDPNGTGPNGGAPGATAPGGAMPGTAAPPGAVPGTGPTALPGAAAGGALPGAAAPAQDGGDTEGPQGEGWIVQLTGHHYHNPDRAGRKYGAQYVRDTLIKNLREKKVFLPSADQEKVDGGQRKVEPVSTEQLGISYPVLIPLGKVYVEEVEDLESDAEDEGAHGGAVPGVGGMIGGQIGAPGQHKMLELRRFDFKVQFVWKQTPPTVRKENAEKEKAEEEELARNQQL